MRKSKYTDDQIVEAVKVSDSVSQVMKKIGMKWAGGSHCHLKNRIKKLGLDTSHFTGQAHNKGKRSNNRLSSKEILVFNRLNGRKDNIYRLRRALDEIGIDYLCSVCGQGPSWNGLKLTLQIDHINGNPLDNRKENIRWICPNCHSQTDTFGIKNKRPCAGMVES